jgi:cytochrome oxidase assembly protein ShyY1
VRFLFTRRWVLFALTVLVLAWLATLLGQWQFHRLHDKKADNSRIATNLDQPPVPIDQLLAPGKEPGQALEWRKVVVHGTWDDAHTIVLKYQTRESGPGVDVVTPLRTVDGRAVLVDRGWLETDNVGSQRPDLPAASAGQVTVIGWIRNDATGRAARVADLATRALSSKQAASVLPYPLYGGFLDLQTESPAPATILGATELPDDTSDGPHFFYGLQWWFFGALAIFGFGYLAYDEWRQARALRAAPGRPSERPEHAAVDREHHTVHEG